MSVQGKALRGWMDERNSKSEVSKVMLMDRRGEGKRQQEVIHPKEERWRSSQPPVLSDSVELTQQPDLKQRDLVSEMRGSCQVTFTSFCHAHKVKSQLFLKQP